MGFSNESDSGRSTLIKYQTLGNMTGASLARLVFLFQTSCAASAAVVGILNAEGQWIRSLIGAPEKLAVRYSILCGFAMSHSEFFEIEDLLAYPQLADDPLVRLEPHLRFFAGTLLRNIQQEVIGVLCLFDTKPRKLAETEKASFKLFSAEIENQLQLQVSLQLLRAKHQEHLRRLELFEGIMRAASNIAVISTDVDGVIRLFNAEAERMLGYQADEMIGRETPLLFHLPTEIEPILNTAKAVEPRAKASKFLSDLAQQNQIQELTYTRKNGSIFPVSLSVAETRSEEGELSGFVSIAQDRTEQKAIERLKDDFISLVSHELRTPLTSILGSLGLVCGGVVGVIPKSSLDLLNIAHANGKRLLRLINDILDLNKLAAGKLEFDFKPCNLLQIVQRSIEANAAYAAQHHTEFFLTTKEALAWVRADADRLLQVMANLLSNAAKFSPAQQPIEVSVHVSGRSGRVSVRDRGPGIPLEFQPLLFERFQQAHTDDTRQRGGTGLGLNISKLIIEQHAGTIGFETGPQQGTTFYFELPMISV
jgi:PAS domain S-box-containing protein